MIRFVIAFSLMDTWFQIGCIGAVLFSASLIQSVVGFGFGLFAIPIMVWLGLSLPEAIAMAVAAVLFQTGHGTYALRSEVPWKFVWLSVFFRAFTCPIGIFLLWLVNDLPKSEVKQVVGALVLLAVMAQKMWHAKPTPNLPIGWAYFAFSCSGILGGLSGMNGPPLVLWVLAQTWSSTKMRAFLLATFFFGAPISIAMLFCVFWKQAAPAFVMGLVFIPLGLLGSMFGLRIGNQLPKERLRALAIGLLMILALGSILSPYLE